MEKKNKIYCGSFKTVNSPKGTFFKIGFSMKDIDTLSSNLNEKGYVNLAAFPKFKGPDEYGRTHDLTVDTWKPTSTASTSTAGFSFDAPKPEKKKELPNMRGVPTQQDIDDLPF